MNDGNEQLRNKELICNINLGSDYIDIRPLESGSSAGMGVLFRGYKRGLGVEVVIKRVKAQLAGRLDQTAEANILKEIKHTYLPRIYDIIYDHENGYYYTVMDLIPGINMQQYVQKNGVVDQKKAYRWATELCEVVQYLHQQKPPILHCDIKPANVMITPEGDICLIDFNTSLFYSSDARNIGATNGFAAPEQYFDSAVRSAQEQETEILSEEEDKTEIISDAPDRNDATEILRPDGTAVTCATDIYAIGATLYYLVTGKVPEKSTDDVTSLSALHPDISDTFVRIIERAMQKAPEGRFSDADQMLLALQSIVDTDRTITSIRRTRKLAVALLSGLLAVSSLSAFYGAYRTFVVDREQKYLMSISQANSDAAGMEYKQAISELNDAIANRPERPEAYVALGTIYYQIGDYEDGYHLVENALQSKAFGDAPSSGNGNVEQISELYYVAASCCYGMERYGEAEQLYKDAVDCYGANSAYYRGLAMSQAQQAASDSKKLEKAKETLSELKRKFGNDIDTQIAEAEICNADGDTKSAVALYRDVLSDMDAADHAGEMNRIYLQLAQIYDKEADYSSEEQILEEAVKKLGDNAILEKQMLGSVYISLAQEGMNAQQNYQKAISLLSAVNEASSGVDTATELNLATAYEGINDYSNAEKVLEDLMQKYPGDYRPYMRMAYLCIENKNLADVLKWYQKAEETYKTAQTNGAVDANMETLKNYVKQIGTSQ